jgi:5'-nucleotidase (lipoprotein e(P4) family)
MKIKYLFILCVAGLIGCRKPPEMNDQTHLIQSVLWYQHSAEMHALYYQAFNWAGQIVRERSKLIYEKPPAVILDIDETVLDNSPVSGYQILENVPFSDNLWERWCNKTDAKPLPGSVDFTRLADKLGVEVFYVSNRTENLLNVTLSNLKKHGFPNADSTHVLLKKDTSSKELRNNSIRENFKIILIIGDNLSDFDEAFEERFNDRAKMLVRDQSELFGAEYIVLPNPVYGSWDNPFRAGEEPASEKRKKALISFE